MKAPLSPLSYAIPSLETDNSPRTRASIAPSAEPAMTQPALSAAKDPLTGAAPLRAAMTGPTLLTRKYPVMSVD